MVEFTVKEVARHIDTSTQYIYQQMEYLVANNLAYRNEKGKPVIYDKGLEYLKDKRMENLQVANKGLQKDIENNNGNISNTTKNDFASNENVQEIIKIYKDLYEQEKQESQHWKELYIEKDRALTEITSKFLLPPATEEQTKKKKWKFWQ